MDGQLGVNGGNFLVPCLLERFLEVGSATESEVPLQVWKELIYLPDEDKSFMCCVFLLPNPSTSGLFC